MNLSQKQYLISIFVLAIAAIALPAFAGFPTVSSDYRAYNDGTSSGYDFIYTVVADVNNSYNFGYLQIDTNMNTSLGTSGWIASGPFAGSEGGSDLGWSNGTMPGWYDEADVEYTSVFWRSSGSQEVMKKTDWTGVFVLRVPNCIVTRGSVMTKDGVISSANASEQFVPGVVPEPTGLMSIFSGAIGMAGFISRRRRH